MCHKAHNLVWLTRDVWVVSSSFTFIEDLFVPCYGGLWACKRPFAEDSTLKGSWKVWIIEQLR